VSTTLGRVTLLGELFASVTAAIVFYFVEGRHRKALDFIATSFAFHFLLTTFLCSFPRGLTWWVFFFVFLALSTIAAELLSLHSEMKDIDVNTTVPAGIAHSQRQDANSPTQR
jgi:hypothetical protein